MQATKKLVKKPGQQEMSIKLKYDMTHALYANQFVMNQAADELFVDFSSGPIPDPTSGQTLIPVHTRLAMSFASAKRLAKLLTQAVENHEKSQA